MGTEAWSSFTNRANLSDNDNAQVMLLDTTLAAANQNQRTPVTQVLRSGRNFADLGNLNTALTNLGATSLNTASALVRRDGSGNFNMGILTANGFTAVAGASSANITGSNPALNIGPSGNIDFAIGRATNASAFFSNTASGDGCIRVGAAGGTLRLGVGSGTSSLDMTAALISGRVNLSILSAANPTLNLGTNGNIAQSTSNAVFFSNGLSGDVILRQTSTSNSIRIGVGTSSSGLDVSLTQVSVNLATLSCAGALTVVSSATVGSLLVPTSGATAAPLDYYENNSAVDFNISVSTPDGTNHDLPLRVSRIGNIVILTSFGLGVTATTAARFVAAAGSIPVKWRPLFTTGIISLVSDNGSPVEGLITIQASGSLEVGVGMTSGNFTNTGVASIAAFQITYLTS